MEKLVETKIKERERAETAREGSQPMAIICPKCNSKNVKQVARRMKTKYGRVRRRFLCGSCGYAWSEERWFKSIEKN